MKVTWSSYRAKFNFPPECYHEKFELDTPFPIGMEILKWKIYTTGGDIEKKMNRNIFITLEQKTGQL